MKLLSRLVLPGVLFVSLSSSYASEGGNDGTGGGGGGIGGGSGSDLTTYLLNLGEYLGYNIQNSPTVPPPISSTFLDPTFLQLIEGYLFNTFLGALPINSTVPEATQYFVPSGSSYASTLNPFGNYTFSSQNQSPYSTPSTTQVSVSALLDQPPYQNDPVSQAILNILTTPDYSYCLTNSQDQVTGCTYPSGTMNEYQVAANVVGAIPPTGNFFTYDSNQQLLSQLNGNSLISPLLYSTTGDNSTQSNTTDGLVAQSQAQQASNFIRYAGGLVAPLQLPNRKDYDTLYTAASTPLSSTSPYTQVQQLEAQGILANYLANLRIYTAQMSVGLSNLYYIMSKRLPQKEGGSGNATQTSQALSEFGMATWRLYNPTTGQQNTQWLEQINTASPATVQKEMAILLAELNYQLYLNRQQEERLLLTESIILLQNLHAEQPSSSSITSAATSASGGSSSSGSSS